MEKYSDIDLFLVKNELTGDISYKKDLQSIAQGLTNIALTRKGEVPFTPNLGCSLVDEIQIAKDTIALNQLKQTIKSQLQLNDRRVIIDNIEFIKNLDNCTVNITFILKETGAQGIVNLTV